MQAVTAYYATLQQYAGLDVTHETAVRSAMQNLLSEAGKEAGWTLVPEQRLANGKVPDGTFRDAFNLARGYWEAKDTGDDLETEIRKKIALGYPLANMMFEDTRRAVLYQGRNQRYDYDLAKPAELREMLRQFTTYETVDTADFYRAVDGFASQLPDLAKGLMQRIETERAENRAFTTAFAQFHELCRNALNPQISADVIEEMLVQHLLTERLFRTIFENPDFTRRNVIAHEIENVIDALTSRAFNRQQFLSALDKYYVAIETKGRGITDWQEKQGFLNRVYERFFQGFSTRQADTHGIVYTPQEIVDFMCASVEHLLQTEFGTSLSTPGVQILDPCTGTGNFVVNLLGRMARRDLKRKYTEDIFANEIMLLPYYIASLNIEHAYFTHAGEYLPFDGLCFTDTLTLAKGVQTAMFEEANSDRVEREKEAAITVIIGNPPYNVGQQNENDNNKNRRYPVVDDRVSKTYAKESKASLKNKMSDAYVKFFRWATDRLQGHDGIICYVSNNGFLSSIGADGMRKCLLDEFTTIYHLDCGGNVRKNPKLSGTTHNVFGIQVGVGITFLVRQSKKEGLPSLFYHSLPLNARATERLGTLKSYGSLASVAWQELTPDTKGNWLTEGFQEDFSSFLPLGTKEGKASKEEAPVIFKTYSLGVSTNRDNIVYDFNKQTLEARVMKFVDDYNDEVARWTRAGRPKNIDNFVSYDKVKWSHFLKNKLKRGNEAVFDPTKICTASYRPYTKSHLFNDGVLLDAMSLMQTIFPPSCNSNDNVALCLTGVAPEKPFMLLAVDNIPDLHLTGAGTGAQCFPFYVYDEDGTNRRENITDWALQQFREAHGPTVTKWDIFHYVYALLHDPAYRTRYAENLKRELPRIPLAPAWETAPSPPAPLPRKPASQGGEGRSVIANVSPLPSEERAVVGEGPGVRGEPGRFARYADVGEQLLRLHRDYETAPEYRLQSLENRDVPFTWRVEKMRLSKDKTQLVVNEALTLGGIPEACFAYRLGNRSALEWVLDQYQVTTDKRSGLVSDPNRADDPEYIVRLIGQVITVSLETVRLMGMLAAVA